MLLETKNWWFWIDSRVLLPAPRSSFHNYENFDPTIVWQKFMSRLNDEVFLVLCVNRSSTQFDRHCVQLFIKKYCKINDRFYIKMQMFLKNWRIRGFFWKGNLNFTLILKNINKTFYYFSYLLWTHCSTYVYQKREGRKKEEEEIGFETRLSMVKHAFWAAVKRVRKTCINFQNSRMEEPTTKGHSNTRPQRSLRSLNGEKKQHHHNFQNLCQWARNMRTHFFKVCQSH